MFKAHYKAVQGNVNLAARILGYHLELASHVTDNQDNYNALNNTARFWNDFNFMAMQTVIMSLGKVFDDDQDTHNLSQMMKSLRESLDYFGKEKLRQRKLSWGLTDQQMLDDAIDHAHEMSLDDVKVIAKKVREARALWVKIKPLRDKFYAHHEAMSDEDRDALFKDVTYDELEEIIQIMLDVCFVLEVAELNGTKPNFDDYTDNRPENVAAREIDKWLPALVKGYNKQSV